MVLQQHIKQRKEEKKRTPKENRQENDKIFVKGIFLVFFILLTWNLLKIFYILLEKKLKKRNVKNSNNNT